MVSNPCGTSQARASQENSRAVPPNANAENQRRRELSSPATEVINCTTQRTQSAFANHDSAPSSHATGFATQESAAQETLRRMQSTSSPRTRALVEMALSSVIAGWDVPRSAVAPTHLVDFGESQNTVSAPTNTLHNMTTTNNITAQSRAATLPSSIYDTRDLTLIPACVREAVLQYEPLPGCKLIPPTSKERSLIFKYGVRVETTVDGTSAICWICLASQACRDLFTLIPLSSGRTSKVAHILASSLCRDDARRLALLLETQRIVNNNLPFCFGEYHESHVIKEVCTKPEYQATINSRTVTHAIIELYASANREVTGFMRDNRVGPIPCFVMVADFWSSKNQGEKYLGLRVYLVDAQFRFRSVLLGVRHFRPLYGERDQGIRAPFLKWLNGILSDFQLKLDDFFGATTDGGPDVKWMMTKGLSLQWEWCVPHLVNAATKAACGMTQKSKNPDMSELINRISQTIFQAHRNEKLGDLMEQLMLLLGQGNTKKLVAYKPHRFLGLAGCIRRILEKWEALRCWFGERITKAIREGKRDIPIDFPLVNEKGTLEQILSLLSPIELVTKRAQSETPNQVDVLLTLYTLQTTVFAIDTPVQRFDSLHSAPVVIQPTDLTPCAKTTRVLLQRAFYKNFFMRYYERKYMASGSFVFEMQYLLHPAVKHTGGPMDAIVRVIALHQKMPEAEVPQHVAKIRRAVIRWIKGLMKRVVEEMLSPASDFNRAAESPRPIQHTTTDVFSADIMLAFSIQQAPPSHPRH